MVAGAIAGLKPESVTVSDLNGRTWYGSPDDAAGGGDNVYLALKRTYEQDLKTKILGACVSFPTSPSRPACCRTASDSPASAGPTVCSRRPTRQPPCDRCRREGSSGRPRGDRGPATEYRHDPRQSAGRRPQRGRSDGTGRGRSRFRVQVEKESVGFTPTVAGVSVGVPISYFKKVWQERNPAEPGRTPQMPDPAALDRVRSRNRRRSNGTWPNCSPRSTVRPKRRNWSP